jgi:hypothetical protein
VKVRGPAAVIYERYLQLARDAASSGDRVRSENYLQHADHYFRLVRAMQPAMPPQPERFGGDNDYEGDDDGAPEGESADEGESVSSTAPSGGDQPNADFPQDQEQRALDRDNDQRRRRGRRNRFRPSGGEGETGETLESEGRRDREENDGSRRPEGPRRERPPREREERRPRDQENDRDSGVEGFSNGPKPAFLRD